MFELITIAVFVCLMAKSIGLALRLTWGMAKVIAAILMVLAVPVLILCLIFLSGIALIVPLALVGIAVGILKTCS